MKQILSITPEGITYLDENHQEQFVDFQQCYENYLIKKLAPEIWEGFKKINPTFPDDYDYYTQWRKAWREVGVRDVTGNPAYIEFHTQPPTRFEFAIQEAYEALRDAMWETSWVTFDLS